MFRTGGLMTAGLALAVLMGRGEIDHQMAQMAAWYLNNQISWQQL